MSVIEYNKVIVSQVNMAYSVIMYKIVVMIEVYGCDGDGTVVHGCMSCVCCILYYCKF